MGEDLETLDSGKSRHRWWSWRRRVFARVERRVGQRQRRRSDFGGGGVGTKPGENGGRVGLGIAGGSNLSHRSALLPPSVSISLHNPVLPLGLSGSKST